MTPRLVEIARLRCDTFAAADAVRVEASALGCSVELRDASSCWLVIVEALHDAPAIGEHLALVARARAAA